MREVSFMCSGLDSPVVSMPVFMKILGTVPYPMPDNYVSIPFKDGRIVTYKYMGHKNVINYFISDRVYTIKPLGTCEEYSPLKLWDLKKKIYVSNLRGEGVLIGNSRGRIFNEDNAIALFEHANLKNKDKVQNLTF